MGKASPSIKKVRTSYCMVDDDGVCNVRRYGVKLDECMSC